MHFLQTTLLALGILISPLLCLAQVNRGLPFITNYSTKQYKQGIQNFAVIQDQRGLLYFGNNNGVMEYDGIRWRLIPVSNKSEVHSLAMDSTGRIYVGAQGDFGYLKANVENGKLEYVSLLDLLATEYHNFNDVWHIALKNNEVYFRSTNGIYKYANNQIVNIPLPNSNHRSAMVYNDFWIWISGQGITRLVGDQLELITGGELFKNETVHTMLEYSDGKVLVIANNSGAYIYDGQQFKPFVTEIDAIIKGQSIFSMKLKDSLYALGTRRNGLLVIDQHGKLIHQIDKSAGLQDETIWGICADRFTGDLWLAMNNGLSIVEISSPFTRFGEESGVRGQFYHLAKYKDRLYGASSVGVFTKQWKQEHHADQRKIRDFDLVADIQTQSWYFYTDKNTLLAATNSGIFQIEGNKATNIGFDGRAWFFVELIKFPNHLLVNSSEGLILLKKEQERWNVVGKVKAPKVSLYYFVQDSLGNLWADNPIKGIYKFTFNQNQVHEPEVVLYDHNHGLPSNLKVRAFNCNGQIIFGTEKGAYRFDAATNQFKPHQELNTLLFESKPRAIEWLQADRSGNIWFIIEQEKTNYHTNLVGYATKVNGKYQLRTNAFYKIQDYRVRDFFFIDSANVVLGTSDGLIHYNPHKEQQPEFSVLLRKIELINGDSSLFNGAFVDELGNLATEQSKAYNYNLAYSQNSLRFSFSSMDFKVPASNLYQYKLEGLDQDWGPWSTSHEKEYTNLMEGSYRLLVRAKNQYNQLSSIQVLSFSIAPPWYRTMVAYAFYLAMLSIVVVGSVRVYAQNLREQNDNLERLVSERTAEVRKQNEDILEKNHLLESQNEEIEAQKEDIVLKNQELEKAREIIAKQVEQLQSVNQNLETKVNLRTEELRQAYQDLLVLKNELETFIYKSSHDIKGPMMRLKGLCQVALLDIKDQKSKKYIQLLANEAEGTIKVLQKLLVFYEVKNSVPTITRFHLEDQLYSLLEEFKKDSTNTDVMVQLHLAPDVHECKSDPAFLKIALQNIIDNALIFKRPDSPLVSIEIEQTKNNSTIVKIKDNGAGVSKEVENKIFDMFYRGSERSQGPGLGLYTAREAVKKIGGEISFKREGDWTVFTLQFPTSINFNELSGLVEA